MLELALMHPFWSVLLAWLAVVGLGHVAKVAVEIVRQPFLFYRHIAEGHRIRAHRAEMRRLYEEFGTTPAEQRTITAGFEPIDEEFGNVFRKVA